MRNGGDKKWAIPMALVAWAESGGQSRCVNQIKATGLWQIYNGPNTDTRALQNPNTNAKAAIAKFKAGKLQPWVSSKGAWGNWISDTGEIKPGGLSELKNLGIDLDKIDLSRSLSLGGPGGDLLDKAVDSVKNPIESLIEPIQDIANVFIQVGDFLIHPRRLLKLVVGGVLLLWGLGKLSGSLGGPKPRRIARAASNAVPAGKATSAVAKAT